MKKDNAGSEYSCNGVSICGGSNDVVNIDNGGSNDDDDGGGLMVVLMIMMMVVVV